jgi:NADH-quinone oxidoreductase subunit J
MWLMLPRGNRRGRWLGAVLGAAGLGLLASRLPGLGDWVSQSVFWAIAGVTVASAAATVTFRSPVYSAIWFGLTLLGTGGLLLILGAQFLGVATVVVYAGAILVTFLFVLMLAQPEGHAYYDRLSWEGFLASLAGALLVGMMSLVAGSLFGAADAPAALPAPADERALADGVLADQHVARLAGELFGRHLVEIELVGTLLLVALVGCVAIVQQGRQRSRREAPDA